MELTEELKKEICEIIVDPVKIGHWIRLKELGFDRYLPAEFTNPKEITEKYRTNDSLKLDIEKLESRISDLENENQNLNDKLEEIDRELEEAKDKIEQLEGI